MNEDESMSFDTGWDSESFGEPEDVGEDEAARSGGEGESLMNKDLETGGTEPPEGVENRTAADGDSLASFASQHPQLKAESIPDEVWAQVASGETLENAWLRYQAKWTGLVMDEMARENENRLRSTGSRKSEGGSGRADPFDEGWREI